MAWYLGFGGLDGQRWWVSHVLAIRLTGEAVADSKPLVDSFERIFFVRCVEIVLYIVNRFEHLSLQKRLGAVQLFILLLLLLLLLFYYYFIMIIIIITATTIINTIIIIFYFLFLKLLSLLLLLLLLLLFRFFRLLILLSLLLLLSSSSSFSF